MTISLETFKAAASATYFSTRDIVVQGQGKDATARLGNFIFSQGKAANNATMKAFKEALEKEYGSLGTRAASSTSRSAPATSSGRSPASCPSARTASWAR